MSNISEDIVDEDRFLSPEDFKESINHGAEICFIWNSIEYGIVRYGTDNKITMYEAYKPETERVFETADDALDTLIGNDRLRDIITLVEVTERTV